MQTNRWQILKPFGGHAEPEAPRHHTPKQSVPATPLVSVACRWIPAAQVTIRWFCHVCAEILQECVTLKRTITCDSIQVYVIPVLWYGVYSAVQVKQHKKFIDDSSISLNNASTKVSRRGMWRFRAHETLGRCRWLGFIGMGEHSWQSQDFLPWNSRKKDFTDFPIPWKRSRIFHQMPCLPVHPTWRWYRRQIDPPCPIFVLRLLPC